MTKVLTQNESKSKELMMIGLLAILLAVVVHTALPMISSAYRQQFAYAKENTTVEGSQNGIFLDPQ